MPTTRGTTRSAEEKVSLRRLGKILALLLGILATPLAVQAQGPRNVPKIGYLVLSPLADPPSAERRAFLEALRDLGYVVGQNLIIEYRAAAWNRELLPQQPPTERASSESANRSQAAIAKG